MLTVIASIYVSHSNMRCHKVFIFLSTLAECWRTIESAESDSSALKAPCKSHHSQHSCGWHRPRWACVDTMGPTPVYPSTLLRRVEEEGGGGREKALRGFFMQLCVFLSCCPAGNWVGLPEVMANSHPQIRSMKWERRAEGESPGVNDSSPCAYIQHHFI